MTSPLDDEIRGDWSNLKGTEYHFVYTLWLLLCAEATSVAFYAGNDLHAHPIHPPRIFGNPADAAPIGMESRSADEDIWIQLKATEREWTCSLLLQGNLLANFLWNALFSQQRGRSWRVRLVSQGYVQRAEVEAFCDAPHTHRNLYKSLQKIVAKVQQRWNTEMQPAQPVDRDNLQDIAIAILRQLAASQPVRLETLKAEIECELAYNYPDRRTVRHIANQLLGELLTATAPGPKTSVPYTIEWLSQVIGHPLRERSQSDDDPVDVCAQAVCDALPATWQSAAVTPRPQLLEALERFCKAPQSVFVLAGTSGAGKSWAVADWTLNGLDNQVRLLIPGAMLNEHRTLSTLVAEQLRPYVQVDWTDEAYLRWLKGAAIRTSGSPVIVLDDISVPSHDRDAFQRQLGRLASDSARHGFKLVLVVQTYTWRLHQLDRNIAPSLIFHALESDISGTVNQDNVPNEENREGNASAGKESASGQKLGAVSDLTTISFLLGDATPDEQFAMLQRQLPEERVQGVAIQLRDPAYLPLRNPYLLQRYLDVYGAQLSTTSRSLTPVDVDALIDERLTHILDNVANAIGCVAADLIPAVDALISQMWERRPYGLSYPEAVHILDQHVPHQGANVLAVLRGTGILSADTSIRLIEPRLRDRLFARHLIATARRPLHEEPPHLSPAEDAGVVQTLLRSRSVDAVALASVLLARDARWRVVIADGLAMCSPNDDRVIALLIALTRPREGRLIVDNEVCLALGRLAARGGRAWNRVAKLYLSYDNLDRVRGEHALAGVIDVAPKRAAAAMRLRLHYALRRRAPTQQRARWLKGLLTPLQGISHPAAAAPVRRVLQRYIDALEASGLQDDLDTARGIFAVHHTDEAEIETLLALLQDPDPQTRYRAAEALRPIIFARPKQVATVLCNAIRIETEQRVLRQLLWISYPLRVHDPGPLLDAVTASLAYDWEHAPQVSSVALVVLAHLAHHDAGRVRHLLPFRLASHDPARRALYAEILAYVWWVCGEYDDTARSHLQSLADIDISESPPHFRVFVWRGKILAQLAITCIGSISSKELIGRQFPYIGSDREFLLVDTTSFVRQHAPQILDLPSAGLLLDMLYEALGPQPPGSGPVPNGIFPDIAYGSNVQQCSMLTLEMLVALLLAHSDINVSVLQRVCTTERPLYIIGRLLEEGRRDTQLIVTARELCAQQRGQVTSTQIDDWTFCIQQLVASKSITDEDLAAYLARVGRSSFWQQEVTAIMAASLDAYLDRSLPLLDSMVRSPNDVPKLFYWSQEAHSWQNLLLSQVYRRAFDSQTIGQREACSLCQDVLIAVRALPSSPEQQHYEYTYTCILHALEGRPLPLPRNDVPQESVIAQSLNYALSLLHTWADQRLFPPDALYAQLVDERGYWEAEGYEYAEGRFSYGSGVLGYMFPHVRLAFIALSLRYGQDDPGGRILAERQATARRFKQDLALTRNGSRFPDSYVEQMLERFNDQIRKTPYDERIRSWLGLILLHLDRLEEAEQVLRQNLSFSYRRDNLRGEVLYNLACVYARQNRYEECRLALEESARYWPLDIAWMAEDPDLAAVRELAWFRQLIANSQSGPSEQ